MVMEWGRERSLALDRLDLGLFCATDQRGPEPVSCFPGLSSLICKAGIVKFTLVGYCRDNMVTVGIT